MRAAAPGQSWVLEKALRELNSRSTFVRILYGPIASHGHERNALSIVGLLTIFSFFVAAEGNLYELRVCRGEGGNMDHFFCFIHEKFNIKRNNRVNNCRKC